MSKCKKHPRYQAKRRPTAKCLACWDMWWAQCVPVIGDDVHEGADK